jgi:hypothetical protein
MFATCRPCLTWRACVVVACSQCHMAASSPTTAGPCLLRRGRRQVDGHPHCRTANAVAATAANISAGGHSAAAVSTLLPLESCSWVRHASCCLPAACRLLRLLNGLPPLVAGACKGPQHMHEMPTRHSMCRVQASYKPQWPHAHAVSMQRPTRDRLRCPPGIRAATAAAAFAAQLRPPRLGCGAAAIQVGADGGPVQLLAVQHLLPIGRLSGQSLQLCLILLPPTLPGSRRLGYRSQCCCGRRRCCCCWLRGSRLLLLSSRGQQGRRGHCCRSHSCWRRWCCSDHLLLLMLLPGLLLLPLLGRRRLLSPRRLRLQLLLLWAAWPHRWGCRLQVDGLLLLFLLLDFLGQQLVAGRRHSRCCLCGSCHCWASCCTSLLLLLRHPELLLAALGCRCALLLLLHLPLLAAGRLGAARGHLGWLLLRCCWHGCVRGDSHCTGPPLAPLLGSLPGGGGDDRQSCLGCGQLLVLCGVRWRRDVRCSCHSCRAGSRCLLLALAPALLSLLAAPQLALLLLLLLPLPPDALCLCRAAGHGLGACV